MAQTGPFDTGIVRPRLRGKSMFRVLSGAWALLLGMMLLQVGNGMQGTSSAFAG